MAKLTSKRRNSLPKSSFGLPGERKYPMPDASHAANAKARASQAVNAGRMSRSTEAAIDRKADSVMHKGGKGKKVVTKHHGGQHPKGAKTNEPARHSFSKIVHGRHAEKMSEC